MYALVAAELIHAYCKVKFPPQEGSSSKAYGNYMATTVANGPLIDAFDHVGGGSHKYIPTTRLNADLSYPDGAGVFGYWKMKDGSYLLRTCEGPLAVWSGKDDEPARRVE